MSNGINAVTGNFTGEVTITNKGLSATTGNFTGAVTVGTITAGTWNGSIVGVGYGGTGLSSVTAGSILFGNSGTELAQDNTNLFWDNLNNRLGIGTTSPAYTLDVNGSLHANGDTYFEGTVGVKQQVISVISGTAAVDWRLGNKAKLDKSGNVAVTFTTNPVNPANLMVIITHSGSGTLTIDSRVKWPGGVLPTFSTGSNAIDIVSFYWDGVNYYGMASVDFK